MGAAQEYHQQNKDVCHMIIFAFVVAILSNCSGTGQYKHMVVLQLKQKKYRGRFESLSKSVKKSLSFGAE